MVDKEAIDHWESVYATKTPAEVSWTEVKPEYSLALIEGSVTSKNSPIIDVGGGDSLLVDFLLAADYKDITVLDISPTAIKRAQKRLGEKANSVNWIVTDILNFKPARHYEIWHDRAAFHFLTTDQQKARYKSLVDKAIITGHLILGTFSTSGPIKCSGLPVQQYDASSLSRAFSDSFAMTKHFYADHVTPFQTRQNFLFADFIKTLQ